MKAMSNVSQISRSLNQTAQKEMACAAPLSMVQIIHSDGGILMKISEGEHKIKMHYHTDEQLTVTVNGQSYQFSAADAPRVSVDTGRETNSLEIAEEFA